MRRSVLSCAHSSAGRPHSKMMHAKIITKALLIEHTVGCFVLLLPRLVIVIVGAGSGLNVPNRLFPIAFPSTQPRTGRPAGGVIDATYTRSQSTKARVVTKVERTKIFSRSGSGGGLLLRKESAFSLPMIFLLDEGPTQHTVYGIHEDTSAQESRAQISCRVALPFEIPSVLNICMGHGLVSRNFLLPRGIGKGTGVFNK